MERLFSKAHQQGCLKVTHSPTWTCSNFFLHCSCQTLAVTILHKGTLIVLQLVCNVWEKNKRKKVSQFWPCYVLAGCLRMERWVLSPVGPFWGNKQPFHETILNFFPTKSKEKHNRELQSCFLMGGINLVLRRVKRNSAERSEADHWVSQLRLCQYPP